MIKPLFVYVLWSESGEFKEKEIYSFAEFELKALKESNSYIDSEYSGGYSKTKIMVLFNDGNTYNCRLDINERCPCFQKHTDSFISYYRYCEDKRFLEMYKDNVEFLKTINFKDY